MMVVVAFFHACKDSGRMFNHLFPPALFFFFLKRKLACAHQFHLLCHDQSTVAQRAEMTVAECSLTMFHEYAKAATACSLGLNFLLQSNTVMDKSTLFSKIHKEPLFKCRNENCIIMFSLRSTTESSPGGARMSLSEYTHAILNQTELTVLELFTRNQSVPTAAS